MASFVEPSKAELFERVQAVVRGERIPLDSGASKVMMFMLQQPEGCDAKITPVDLAIWFGWNRGWHPYFLRTAPAILSWLLDRAGVVDPREVTATLAPTTVPSIHGYSPWSFDRPRHIRIAVQPAQVSIRVRDTAAGLATALPFSEPQYVVLPHACPHCGIVPERYRELSERSLVCLACGASSSNPAR